MPGPREPYCVAMNPLRSADSRYLPGAIPAMSNRPAASVATVWLTFTDTATHPDTITYGVCSFAALLYPEGSSRAAWQSVSTEPHPCPALAVLLAIPSGGTRAALAGRPHRVRSDWDNVAKAVCDALFEEDSMISDGSCAKRWDDGQGARLEVLITFAD